jgi:hypothetical protein
MDLQEGELIEQRNQLSKRISVWEQLQPIYMPGLLQYKFETLGKGNVPTNCTAHPEDVDLWFPSKLPNEVRQRICTQDLPGIEEKLRTAQCYDALEGIRHVLKIKSRLIKFKQKNVRGQKEGLRSRAIIDKVHHRARATAAKYRAARAAKLLLSGSGEWEKNLRVLADADVRAYQDPMKLARKRGRRGTLEDGQISSDVQTNDFEGAMETLDFSLLPEERTQRDGTGETRRTLSWIWLTENAGSPQVNEGDEILRVEWAKSRARAARAAEEVLLLREEMRRVIEFLKWKSEWWLLRAKHQSADKGITEGLRAYAHKNSLVQKNLSEHFQSVWKAPFQEVGTDEVDGDTDGEEGDV